ncbi:MAG: hypothetical protein HN348_24980 [Proteobacteria bacterium]|nr:hypothetical protein [Pseudomonadota bacterium]
MKTDSDLGTGTGEPSFVPGVTRAVQVAVDTGGCARLSNGRVVCWGNPTEPAQQVPSLKDATFIAAEAGRRCAVRRNGQVVCWNFHEPEPAPVPGLSDAIRIDVGSPFACAVDSNGQVRCWGKNIDGHLENRPGPLLGINVP